MSDSWSELQPIIQHRRQTVAHFEGCAHCTQMKVTYNNYTVLSISKALVSVSPP